MVLASKQNRKSTDTEATGTNPHRYSCEVFNKGAKKHVEEGTGGFFEEKSAEKSAYPLAKNETGFLSFALYKTRKI